ncbi:hypothetical protein CYMTET_30185 [Cymbomonas tetramitiformis]|uniref:Uncharacterized protein n=1 Tax=Cymbomonas tetramitiformis TaxID=36881 RepID=A0AAE0FJK6_9CHLO|nr:hypothetical protein CYMTET_30185 [Cymbomonas tetramitiformis]
MRYYYRGRSTTVASLGTSDPSSQNRCLSFSSLVDRGVPSMAPATSPGELLTAAQTGNVNEIGNLIKHGADVTETDSLRQTPLHHAALERQAQCIQALLENGADVNAKSKANFTPLHFAARNGDAQCVELLACNGADVNAKAEYSNTPLHLAAAAGASESVSSLIRNGAVVNQPNKARQNMTALHIAASHGHARCVKALFTAGGKLNAATMEGKTPYDLAKNNGCTTVMDMITGLTKGAIAAPEEQRGHPTPKTKHARVVQKVPVEPPVALELLVPPHMPAGCATKHKLAEKAYLGKVGFNPYSRKARHVPQGWGGASLGNKKTTGDDPLSRIRRLVMYGEIVRSLLDEVDGLHTARQGGIPTKLSDVNNLLHSAQVALIPHMERAKSDRGAEKASKLPLVASIMDPIEYKRPSTSPASRPAGRSVLSPKNHNPLAMSWPLPIPQAKIGVQTEADTKAREHMVAANKMVYEASDVLESKFGGQTEDDVVLCFVSTVKAFASMTSHCYAEDYSAGLLAAQHEMQFQSHLHQIMNYIPDMVERNRLTDDIKNVVSQRFVRRAVKEQQFKVPNSLVKVNSGVTGWIEAYPSKDPVEAAKWLRAEADNEFYIISENVDWGPSANSTIRDKSMVHERCSPMVMISGLSLPEVELHVPLYTRKGLRGIPHGGRPESSIDTNHSIVVLTFTDNNSTLTPIPFKYSDDRSSVRFQAKHFCMNPHKQHTSIFCVFLQHKTTSHKVLGISPDSFWAEHYPEDTAHHTEPKSQIVENSKYWQQEWNSLPETIKRLAVRKERKAKVKSTIRSVQGKAWAT